MGPVSLLTALRVNDHHNYYACPAANYPLGPFSKADECMGNFMGHSPLPRPRKPLREASGKGGGGMRIVSHRPPGVPRSGIPSEQAPGIPEGSGHLLAEKRPLYTGPHTLPPNSCLLDEDGGNGSHPSRRTHQGPQVCEAGRKMKNGGSWFKEDQKVKTVAAATAISANVG